MISDLVASLSGEALEFRESDLPTGIPTSVEKLLPEVIYIPAVKDAADEVKTKEAASFGKIIKVLLDLVEGAEELENISESFSNLHALLNRTMDEDGTIQDNRIDDVKKIETRVEGFIREQFRHVNVEIEIPPPDLKTIFSGARIWLDDGVKGEVDSKGDGLKRAVTFSLLRTFVELRREVDSRQAETEADTRYLFLFEEPELYLHPNAQRILYDALREISTEHQVCVSTHSPYFFSASEVGTFVRLRKAGTTGSPSPPASESLQVNLADNLSLKDAFQIICFENNNAAFFCDRVVLVEGDCDIIYLKHITRTLKPAWDLDARNVAVVRVGGKGSFQRYREFFESFDVEVRIVADLDAIVDQFDKLGGDERANELRSQLLQEVDKVIEESATKELTRKQVERVTSTRTFRERYNRCRRIATDISQGKSPDSDELAEFEQLFSEETNYSRRSFVAQDGPSSELKEELLACLRSRGIVVFSKGAIEEYYPEGAEGPDKPTRAMAACKLVQTPEHVMALCGKIADGASSKRNELQLICECLLD